MSGAPTLEEHHLRMRTVIGAIDAIRVLYENKAITADTAMAHICVHIKAFEKENAP